MLLASPYAPVKEYKKAIMAMKSFSTLSSNGPTESLPIAELAHWMHVEKGKGSRLFLAPIQRSLVWSNEQVINYWDSLLRGYPAGMMIVHRVKKGESNASSQGCDADGKTQQANEEDFLLFDGQQRLTAVLLGLGKGQLKDSRKLWIDFGKELNKNPGLRFQLRMSSTGQPFGYRPDAPNQKLDLGRRQNKWKEWRDKHGEVESQQAFADAKGSDIIDATCAIPFAEVCDRLLEKGAVSTIAELSKREALAEIVNEFVSALEKALNSKVVLQLLGSEIVADQKEYFLFFGRLGQGGTRLSDDELTYSIIKHQYPEIRERMQTIIQGQAGRLAGEVDLVLAALRVAKTLAPWASATEGERISRPSPAFVSQLKSKDREQVQSKFLEIIGVDKPTLILEEALKQIRGALSYNASAHQEGLPAMLLARLPRELVDVLVLFAIKRGADQSWKEDGYGTLRAFVLHWLHFIGDDAKAAWCTFRHAKNENWFLTQESIRDLIGEYEKERIARFMPRPEMLSKLRNDVTQGNDHLPPLPDRFISFDRDGECKPGEALRVLSTNGELVRRALMWLQRDYLANPQFSNYDPTSGRDEDLPVDLDHLIPHAIFAFDWRSHPKRLKKGADLNNFREQRNIVGNSLGNFRWLAASDNRRRSDGPLDNNGGLDLNLADWNKIIPQDPDKQPWSQDDIATFQRLIDLRTLDIYNKLLTESGIEGILPTSPKQQSTDFGVQNGPTEEMHAANSQPTTIQP